MLSTPSEVHLDKCFQAVKYLHGSRQHKVIINNYHFKTQRVTEMNKNAQLLHIVTTTIKIYTGVDIP